MATTPSVGWGGLLPIDTAAGPAGGFADVSCSSARFCSAVDVNGDALTFNGTKWSRPVNVDSDVYGFSSVSCPQDNFCLAADVTGESLTWNGKRWFAQRPEVLTTSLPKAVRNHLYSAKLKATGGVIPYDFSAVSGTPPGLRLTDNGTVSGKPKKTGRFSIKVSVRDPLGERTTSRVSLTVS